MVEITKEYLDKKFKENLEFTSEYLEKLMAEQTKVTFKLQKEYFDTKFEEQIDSLEASSVNEFSTLRDEMSSMKVSIEAQYLRLCSRIDDVENTVAGFERGTTTRLAIIETKLETVQSQLKELSKQSLQDTEVLYRDITKLQKRIAAIEKRMQKLKSN